MKKPLLLALDIGNVCVHINHLNCVEKLGYTEIPDELRNAALAYECGRCSENDFFAELHSMFNGRFSVSEIKNAFDSILIKPVPGMDELVSSFAGSGIKAVFFSDISPTHLRRTREIFPAAKFVPDGIYSFESGALKPSRIMFERFEQLFGKPDLYTDDREELIAGAKDFGWNAVQFTDAELLKSQLMKLRD